MNIPKFQNLVNKYCILVADIPNKHDKLIPIHLKMKHFFFPDVCKICNRILAKSRKLATVILGSWHPKITSPTDLPVALPASNTDAIIHCFSNIFVNVPIGFPNIFRVSDQCLFSINPPSMAYCWDNRVMFVVRYLYDIDSNGYLDEKDFACLALRATIIEGKGEFSQSKLQEHQHIMLSLWEEITQLADFDKELLEEGKISVDEFKDAVQQCCMGKRYEHLPQALKMFIDSNFKMVDINDDGIIDADEYRFSCITKYPIDDVDVVDDAFKSLLNDDDRRRGGITLTRYQELYAEFLGNPQESSAVYLFGPLSEFFCEYEVVVP